METQASPDSMMALRIASVTDVAQGIRSFDLVHPDGVALPALSAGSHVKVRVPNGEIRKYSLCNDQNDASFYQITVKRDAMGQGGSISMFDDAHVGATLMVSAPENAFPLNERASAYLFIAGGIGITPILSMLRSFGELPPAPWKLFYLTQSPETTAFIDDLNAMNSLGAVRIHHDNGDLKNAFDLWPVLERPDSAHIYCCGPRGLMDAVRDMTGHWSPGNVHFESFSDGSVARADDRPFTVTLAKSQQTIEVPVGKSILAVLRENGCTVAASCESGTCGTCRTTLLAGEADHRDMVLMPEEMASQIMICVSRAKSAELVLDI